MLLRELRRSGFEPTWERHENSAALTAALARQAWDIILCDYDMPAFSALAALKLLQDLGLDLPVIVVSGEGGDEFALFALQAGARDYVCKDDLGSLGAVVLRELGQPDSRHSVRKELQARL